MTKGSKLQVQIYVNRRPGDLTAAVLGALPDPAQRRPRIGWVAPLEHDGFRDPQDRDFLDAVGCGNLAKALREFWPAGGPVWDALAVVVLPQGRPGVLLAEGKSYLDELLRGSGTAASEVSRRQIAKAIEWTQRQVRVEPDPERWLGPLYQTANRLAHAAWLRDQNVDAWFVHLLFLDDHTHRATSREEWEPGLREAESALGVANLSWAGHAFLPALAADELSRQPIPA